MDKKEVLWKDSEGFTWLVLVSEDESPDQGVILGPPPTILRLMDDYPEDFVKTLIYHLAARKIVSVDDLNKRRSEVVSAIQATVKLAVVPVVMALYEEFFMED